MTDLGYLTNYNANISVARGVSIEANSLLAATIQFDDTIDKLHAFDVNIAELLGMRNLSSFVGELFASCVIKASNKLFRKNPHQDGYPDLLLMDEAGLAHWASFAGRLREKTPFSPFATYGVEVKATCGSVPTPAQCARLGVEKPDIGDTRIELVKTYDWKAHHQETNNLLGLFWDFLDGKPKIVAVFYSSDLSRNDWGAIVQPREGGGRTTSVSIMTRLGVKKMAQNWVILLDDQRYIEFFERYNRISMRGI